LQTATRAEKDGRDEEYVLCALLHDIGDTLAPFNHPTIAAGIAEAVRVRSPPLDGRAPRHLPGLLLLAPHRPRSQHPRPVSRLEYYELTEEFCAKYDQTAFDPDYVSAPLEHFEPLIRRFLVPKGYESAYGAFDAAAHTG
jgi:predicted HD phosphohydrolase